MQETPHNTNTNLLTDNSSWPMMTGTPRTAEQDRDPFPAVSTCSQGWSVVANCLLQGGWMTRNDGYASTCTSTTHQWLATIRLLLALWATAHRVECGCFQMTLMTTETGPPNHNNKWHTTCIQPHEQLLVGWITGGMTTTGRPPRQQGANGVAGEREMTIG